MSDWYTDGYVHSLQRENAELRRKNDQLQHAIDEIKCSSVNINFAWYGGNP